ncbi:DUF4440 domain-containing protein [Roseibium sp. RKSG952]|uniref:DUF4440 domain-containing protein n=1 Tax=Roseibium sp. RKSG952 TaxID=2529384 RepID=UPI0012BD3F59|nr:DUF4440 domain-containing protein [Roseibium sp. RKSG952]MTI00224.1 DUF4440 domain-containing protein [Roseibium sp. RKSG952]
MADDTNSEYSGNGHANGPGAELGSQAEEALAQLFEDYQSGFNDFDADRICDCFAMPATIWQHERGHVFTDDEELMENIEALLKALDKEGVTHSEFHVASSHISGSAAMVSLDWQQHDGDGDVVFEFTCHYHLLQDGQDWAIAMIINE